MSQAGKGDKRRPENKTTSDKNYDKIDWSRKSDFKRTYQQNPIEDVGYLAAIEFKYLTESFDRSLLGRFNSHNEWIPHNLARASGYSVRVIGIISRKYDLKFKDFKNFLNLNISFERATEEYNRLIKSDQFVDLHEKVEHIPDVGQMVQPKQEEKR